MTFNKDNKAKVNFIDFPGGDFSKVVDTNTVVTIESPDGNSIKTFIGGRDDAFFNDLPGFFRSINYAPQFYHVPHAMKDKRELEIPKTLLELEGNKLYTLVKFITQSPKQERIVRTWGESWVLKASSKIDTLPDKESYAFFGQAWAELPSSPESGFNDDIANYKRVDLDGVPFLDAALNEREDERQLANNIKFARHYVIRFAHLGWGFGPSISALGLGTCFNHDNLPISVHKTYALATLAFPRVKKCFFQRVNMPDNTWNKSGLDIKPLKTFEVFILNVASIDMDTTGTWPFGRRLEDQVASRFLSLFLDMEAGCGGKKCNVETLQDQSLWDRAPIVPKTPPNPVKNDKEFLKEFPYLAEPW